MLEKVQSRIKIIWVMLEKLKLVMFGQMSAGTEVVHSEYNYENEDTNLYQILDFGIS